MTSAGNRIWTFATIIVVIIMVVLGWFLGVAPKLGEAARAEADRVLVAAQNQATTITLEQLRQDAERLSELEADLQALQNEFPELPESDELVEAFIRGALDDGVVIENLALSEPAPADPLIVIDQFGQVPEGTLLAVDGSLTVLGDLSNVLDFVARLQAAERFTLVTGVVFADEDDDARTTITLEVFLISGPPAEGALPLGGAPIVEEEPSDSESVEGE